MDQSFFVKTYGCQMNQYDSEKIDELLIHNGFKKAKNLEVSDVSLIFGSSRLCVNEHFRNSYNLGETENNKLYKKI